MGGEEKVKLRWKIRVSEREIRSVWRRKRKENCTTILFMVLKQTPNEPNIKKLKPIQYCKVK